jgi:hypothetical protein
VVHKNVTKRDESTIEAELASIRERLGDSLYEELLANNRDDMEVFNEVVNQYRSLAP